MLGRKTVFKSKTLNLIDGTCFMKYGIYNFLIIELLTAASLANKMVDAWGRKMVFIIETVL